MEIGKRYRIRGMASIVAAAAMICLFAGTSHADAAKGKSIFDGAKCGDCHQMKGPATEKTFADQLSKKGPELWYAGSKFNQKWLEDWMVNPTIIRMLKYNSAAEKNPGNHPKLSASDSKEVASYLVTLKSDAVKTGLVKPANSPMARLNFTKKSGCIGCHAINQSGKTIGGVSGPDLSDAGERLNGDWVFAYLMNPEVFKPVKRMPIFVGIIGESDMKSLAAYVASQKSK